MKDPLNATAAGVKESIDRAFKDANMTNYPQALVGLNTDGASVNLGKVGGLQSILKRESPWLISVWCVAHRLELALVDAFKKTVMDEVIFINIINDRKLHSLNINYYVVVTVHIIVRQNKTF